MEEPKSQECGNDIGLQVFSTQFCRNLREPRSTVSILGERPQGETLHSQDTLGSQERVGNSRAKIYITYNRHGRPEESQAKRKLVVLVEVREIQDDLPKCQWRVSKMGEWRLTSGMKPPWRIPSRALQVRKLVRPESQNCDDATKDHRTSCAGIQRSGPIHLDTSCEGSSADRKASLKTVFPRL